MLSLAELASALQVGFLLGVAQLFQGVILYSEEAVKEAPLDHPFFNVEEHVHEKYFDPSKGIQHDRLRAVEEVLRDASQALGNLGLPTFLESANLIGHVRHQKKMVPWDTDGDLGFLLGDCRKAEQNLLTTSRKNSSAWLPAIQRELGRRSAVEVVHFACRCEENKNKVDCVGDSKRIAGRFTHRDWGVMVDMFAYGPVEEKRDWQVTESVSEKVMKTRNYWDLDKELLTATKNNRFTSSSKKAEDHDHPTSEMMEKDAWYERIGDTHSDFTFPLSSLLPLRSDVFGELGIRVNLPQRPEEWLGWEYGPCVRMGPHPWPWGLSLYVQNPRGIFQAIILGVLTLRGIMLSILNLRKKEDNNGTLGKQGTPSSERSEADMMSLVLEVVPSFIAIYALDNGLAVLALAVFCILSRKWLWNSPLILLCAFELRYVAQQLVCHADAQYGHPMRPKTWTICLFGVCTDFH
ncbi:unnamed protein product [Amoebophrya sp. A25]|nr:unnamed protein product [Amoebophrya sp. A25]|eukprot:GSA25T00008625001.1